MPATFDEAYKSLSDAKKSLEDARATEDAMSKSSFYKVCLHLLCQAVRVAHRTYEIRNPLIGSDGGGTRTWAKAELEEFMGIAYKASARRAKLTPEAIDKDCELWMQRAKFFVDRLSAEAPMVAPRVNETLTEWEMRHTGKIVRWEEKDGELIDRTI